MKQTPLTNICAFREPPVEIRPDAIQFQPRTTETRAFCIFPPAVHQRPASRQREFFSAKRCAALAALGVASIALLVNNHTPVVRPTTDLEFYQQTGIEVGKWHSTKLPDGLEVRANFKVVLSERDKLPTQSNEDGDEWYTTKDDHRWIWMTLPGQSAPAWVDP